MIPPSKSTARRCYHLLARWLRTRRCAKSPLLELPPEIIDMIASHLDGPSLLCFALSCRALHRLCFPRASALQPEQRVAFLLLLEKDLPHLYFCHHCGSLHPWSKSWADKFRGGSVPHLDYGLPCKHEPRFKLTYEVHCYTSIWYHLARVVMNAHLYGAAHGIAVEKIRSPLHSRQDYEHDTVLSGEWRARIIDDQLLVSSSFTAFDPKGEAKVLRRYFDRRSLSICRHLHTRRMHCCGPDGVPELQTRPESEYFATCVSSVHSCAICLTDYCISVERHDGAKGWVVKVATYHQLGPMRSPFDWIWKVATRSSWEDECRWTHRAEYPPGSVRHKWSQGDALTLEPEGAFAFGKATRPQHHGEVRATRWGGDSAFQQPPPHHPGRWVVSSVQLLEWTGVAFIHSPCQGLGTDSANRLGEGEMVVDSQDRGPTSRRVSDFGKDLENRRLRLQVALEIPDFSPYLPRKSRRQPQLVG
ncbi:hypothetical protein VTK73DRAFT_7185 [Phialemonium thermophilum]|uniref:F-box domain-containing protein n=1 Tax=Phialemonium thermophilum TaxID=223376 RepID=A0ABR3WGA8_9PEZI